MTTTQITRTEQADSITYSALIDGAEVSFLTIDAATRKVCNVETINSHTRQGFARALREAANAESECFHDLDHHRTAEGDIFAQAMGGETISDEAGHVDACCICSGDDDTDEDEEF